MMFTSTKQHTEVEDVPDVAPDPLVTLAELAAEGFGWSARTTSPRDAIRALARQFDGAVTVDDLGRQCVSREVAAEVIAERAEVERRRAEERARTHAATPRARPRGFPAVGDVDSPPLAKLGVEADLHDASLGSAGEALDTFLSGQDGGRRFRIEAEQ